LVEHSEAALTYARITELALNPVQGEFDVAHLREVHRRIFQDLPHHGPGEFRPDASGHFKDRRLEATHERVVVPYALRSETDRLLGPTLDALQGGKALQNLDTLEMADALAQTYARLDYFHPFREGNSRTLRTFTAQLARETGHRLDWDTTNVTAQSRDALYIARDVAVIQLRYRGLTADSMMTVEDREQYEMAFQLNRHRLQDPLAELIRRSLERGQDREPYDRRLTVVEAAREIGVIAPIALNQADRQAEEARLAVLRQKASPVEHATAVDMREWVGREGNMAVLSERLGQIETGLLVFRHNPGAPAVERLGAIAAGIDRELRHEHQEVSLMRSVDCRDVER
jgi:cell filamentation protein